MLISTPMSTLAEIEEAVETLPGSEQEELLRFLTSRVRNRSAGPVRRDGGLWSGARERLGRIWGERTLSEREVAEMRDFEDGEGA